MRHVGRAAAEHEDRHVEPGDVFVVEPRYEGVVARAVRDHPAVHRLDELAAVHREDACAVARILLLHLLPLVECGDGLHTAVPRGVGRRHAVVVRELQQAGHTAADPPHREPRGDVGIARGREQRDAGTTRAAGDDRGPEIQVADERAQRFRLHFRFGAAVEHDGRRTAVRPVPREHALSGVGERACHLG